MQARREEPTAGQLCHERMIRDLGDRCLAELIGFELQDAERRQRQPRPPARVES